MNNFVKTRNMEIFQLTADKQISRNKILIIVRRTTNIRANEDRYSILMILNVLLTKLQNSERTSYLKNFHSYLDHSLIGQP